MSSVEISIPDGTVGFARVNVTKLPLTQSGWFAVETNAHPIRPRDYYNIVFSNAGRGVLFTGSSTIDVSGFAPGEYVAVPWVCDTGGQVPQNCRWATPTVFTIPSETSDGENNPKDQEDKRGDSGTRNTGIDLCRLNIYPGSGASNPFSGPKMTVAGKADILDWADSGGWFSSAKSKVSSVAVAGGGHCRAHLYPDPGLAGTPITVTGNTDTLDFKKTGMVAGLWDDIRIGSARASGDNCKVHLFSKTGFSGKSTVVGLLGVRKLFLEVRSVKVSGPERCSAELYTKKGFDGLRIELRKAKKLNWNPAIRSIQVTGKKCRATLYSKEGQSGNQITVTGTSETLSANKLSGAKLKGRNVCEATLYKQPGRQGETLTIQNDEREQRDISGARSAKVERVDGVVRASCETDADCKPDLTCHDDQHVCYDPRPAPKQINRSSAEHPIDLVFVGHKYLFSTSLIRDTTRLLDWGGNSGYRGLMSYEPFKSNTGLFNVYVLPGAGNLETITFSCGILGQKTCTAPKGQSVMNYAEKHLPDVMKGSGDYVTILSPNEYTPHAKLGQYASISLSEFSVKRCEGQETCAGVVLAHELGGHAIGRLMDEYVTGADNGLTGSPNCADDRKMAEAWWGNLASTHGSVGYFDGCGYVSSNVRPTQNSLMRAAHQAEGFGLVNRRELRNILQCRRDGGFAKFKPNARAFATCEGGG